MTIITYIMAILALIGTAANAYMKRWCFLLWMATNAFWCGYDFYIESYAQAGLFGVYFILAIVGWYKWGCNTTQKPQDHQKTNEPATNWQDEMKND